MQARTLEPFQPQSVANGKGGWQLHGTKIWSGSAAWAGVINVFVQLLDANGQSSGMTAFVVRQGTPGLRIGPEALTMGMRGMVQNTIYLNDVPVEPSHLLWRPGAGMEVAQDTFMFARLGLGAISVGGMKRVAQLMHRYATRRSIATGSLLENPVTLARFSEVTAAITSVETLVNLIADLLDAGQNVPEEAYVACKTSGPEFLWKATDTLVQLLGGRGYLENNIAPQMLRDARLFRIFEGPTETLNMFLGSRVLHSSKELDYFLSHTLAAPAVSNRLQDAAQSINARCAANSAFGERSSASRWASVLIGELATYAIMLAAVQKAYQSNQSPAIGRAVEWTQMKFDLTLNRALMGTPDEFVVLSAKQTTNLVSSYAEAIGDLEQTVFGEDHAVDELLRQNSAASPTLINHSGEPISLNGKGLATNLPSLYTAESIQNWLTKWIANELAVELDAIDIHKSFAEYGLDSVTAVKLVSDLGNWLERELSANSTWDYPSIASLAEHLAQEIRDSRCN